MCSMKFNNLLYHFLGCRELPEYGVSDDDYGPLPPPSPSLTPEIKAIVGELLVSIKERVIGYPFRKFEDEIIDPERLYLDDVLENIHSDMYENMDDVSKALSTVIDDGWRRGTISVKARRGEVATFSPKEMSFFVKTIRKTYSKVHDKILEDAARQTITENNNNDDAVIINSGLENTSDARPSAAQPSAALPPVLDMQEISRDILGLGGDLQRPSSQIISIGGESYLLPQEPLPAPDTQQQLVLSQDQAQQLLFAQQQGPQQVLMEQQQQQQMLIEQPLQQQQMLVEQPLQQQMVIEQPLQQQQMLIEHQQLQVQDQPQQLQLQQQDDQQLVLEPGQQHIFLDEHGRQVVLAPEQQLQLVRQFDEGHQLVQIEEQQEQQLVQLEGENGERVMLSFPEHNHLLFQAQEEGMDLG